MTTKRYISHIPVTVNIVIECQLLVLLDCSISENAHTDMVSHSPFGYIAVWVATVIRKSTNATSFCGINELKTKMMSEGSTEQNEQSNLVLL